MRTLQRRARLLVLLLGTSFIVPAVAQDSVATGGAVPSVGSESVDGGAGPGSDSPDGRSDGRDEGTSWGMPGPWDAPVATEPAYGASPQDAPYGTEGLPRPGSDLDGQMPDGSIVPDSELGEPVDAQTEELVVPPVVNPVPAEDNLSSAYSDDSAAFRRVLGDDADDPFGFGIVAALGLRVHGQIETIYTDHVRRLDGGSDWRFRPSVGVAGGKSVGRHMLFFDSSLGRDFYARSSRLNRTRFRFSGGLQWALGNRCGGRFQGGYSTRSTPYDDFAEIDGSSRKHYTAMAALSCRTATGMSMSAAYSYGKTTGESARRAYANMFSHSVNLGLGYNIGRRGRVGLSLGWSDTTNPNQDFGPFGRGGIKQKSIGANARYRIGPSISVDGAVGYTKADPKLAFLDSYSGVTWSAGVAHTGPKTRIRAYAGRSVSTTSYGQSNLRVSRNYGVTAGYTASSRLHFGAGYAHTKRTNRGTSELATSDFLHNYSTKTWHAGASYRMNRLISSSLDFRHRIRGARGTSYGYDTNSVSLTIRVGR